MFDPNSIVYGGRAVLVARFDGADYHGPVPLLVRANALRYSVTIFPGTRARITINKGGWLARKASDLIWRSKRILCLFGRHDWLMRRVSAADDEPSYSNSYKGSTTYTGECLRCHKRDLFHSRYTSAR